jgi:hypothetical protein
MWSFLRPPRTTQVAGKNGPSSSGDPQPPDGTQGEDTFTGYASDWTEDESGGWADNEYGEGRDWADGEDGGSGNRADDEDGESNLDGGTHGDSAAESTPPAIEAASGGSDTLTVPLGDRVASCNTDVLAVPKETLLTWEISALGVLERERRSLIVKKSIPQPKRRRLEVPTRIRRQGDKNKLFSERTEALWKIEKMLHARQSPFEGGNGGLQAHRARAIHSYLHMLVRNDRKRTEASERAAEAQGFAAEWGGRQVRRWAEVWIYQGELPVSQRGRHIKIFTLLEDPNISAELRSYVRSNKWAMDPGKLADFTAQRMIPNAAKTYGTNLMRTEIPTGLK